jgi:hypothetical protein
MECHLHTPSRFETKETIPEHKRNDWIFDLHFPYGFLGIHRWHTVTSAFIGAGVLMCCFKFMSADSEVSKDEAQETRPDFHIHKDLLHHDSFAWVRSVRIVFHRTTSTNGDHSC